MSIFLKLSEIRYSGGVRVTDGLSDDVIRNFAAKDPKLPNAVDHAYQIFIDLKQEFPDMLARDEIDQIVAMHAEIINFYTDDVVNPYVTLAARGPWVITSKGAVSTA